MLFPAASEEDVRAGQESTDDSDAVITGPQRADLAATMRVLRSHPDPTVRREAARLAVVVAALYEQLKPSA